MPIEISRHAPLARHLSQNVFVSLQPILTACTILPSSLYPVQGFPFRFSHFSFWLFRLHLCWAHWSGWYLLRTQGHLQKSRRTRASLCLLSSKHELLSGAAAGFQFESAVKRLIFFPSTPRLPSQVFNIVWNYCQVHSFWHELWKFEVSKMFIPSWLCLCWSVQPDRGSHNSEWAMVLSTGEIWLFDRRQLHQEVALLNTGGLPHSPMTHRSSSTLWLALFWVVMLGFLTPGFGRTFRRPSSSPSPGPDHALQPPPPALTPPPTVTRTAASRSFPCHLWLGPLAGETHLYSWRETMRPLPPRDWFSPLKAALCLKTLQPLLLC